MTTLTCDKCHETAEGVQPAIAHVTEYPTHHMSGNVDDEGSTVTISVDDADPDDVDDEYWGDYEEGDDDDWADE